MLAAAQLANPARDCEALSHAGRACACLQAAAAEEAIDAAAAQHAGKGKRPRKPSAKQGAAIEQAVALLLPFVVLPTSSAHVLLPL